jgi:hypothetical protein
MPLQEIYMYQDFRELVLAIAYSLSLEKHCCKGVGVAPTAGIASQFLLEIT